MLIVSILLDACAGVQSKSCILYVRMPSTDTDRAKRRADINIIFLALLVFMGVDGASRERDQAKQGRGQGQENRVTHVDLLRYSGQRNILFLPHNTLADAQKFPGFNRWSKAEQST